MKYLPLLLLFTIIGLKSISQLNYFELNNLNTICKKEDFEAAKTFLKIKGYEIFKNDENYDHGNYFVIADIIARIKVGEHNNDILKELNQDNIYDKIEIKLLEFDDKKDLRIWQSLNPNRLGFISYSKKFDPLSHWLYDEWDYIREENTLKDSVWERNVEGKINSQAYKSYLTSKLFQDKNEISLHFRKGLTALGERKEYKLFYSYRNIGSQDPTLFKDQILSISTAILLNTEIQKGKNITGGNKNILSFPLFKSGSAYLMNIKFGKLTKTYILDSGASDMTLDDETFQYLKGDGQVKTINNLTSKEYVLADGSQVKFKRVQIPTLSLNDLIVNNINAVLIENGKPLLLGKSFLDSFKSWKVDNKTNTLILEIF